MFNLRRPSPHALAVGLLVAVGIYIRLVGNAFDPVGLWGDEAVWAERLLTKPLSELSIRPIAFMWLVRSSIELFGLSEFTLRLVSTIGGIGTLLLAPYLSRRILRSSSCQLIFIAIIAFHPALVDLSKEFKPYAWEVFVHASVLGLALRYEQKRNPWLALALVVALPLLFLSAYNITFAYPGIYLLFFGRAVIQARRRTPRARLAIATTVLSAVVALAAVGGLYKTSMKPATTKKTSSFWAKKYSSFYVEPSTRPKRSASSASRSRVYFTAVKYFHTTAFPGKTRNPWNMRRPDVEASLVSEPVIREMRGFDYVWWAALHLAGLIGFTRLRRWDRLLLLWLPLLVLAALGALGKWPPGAFRTNTFLILHVTLIGLWGLEYMTGHWPPRRAAAQAPRSSSADDTPPKSNETSSVRPDEPPPPFAAPTRRGRWSLALGAVTTVILTIVPQLIFDPHLYATKRWWTTNFYPTEIADAVVRRNQLEEQSGEGSRAT
ncbi:MAG: glycosyltransferase family 39 protein, partial [Myxococcota bacterium]